MAALQCVERGLFTLDDPDDVHRLLPEWRDPKILSGWTDDDEPILIPAKEKITLRLLLTHTSGIGYDFISPDLMKWRKKRGEGILTMRVPNTEAFTTPLLFEPGSGFAYGGGIDVAGLMIARAENSTLEHYMRRNIFDVLGMDNTSFNLKHRSIGDHLMPMTTRPTPDEVLVDGYASDPLLKQPLEPKDEYGGGGLFSNTEEYLELLKSLLRNDGKLLKPENIDLVFNPCISPSAQESLNKMLSIPPAAAIMIPGEPVVGIPGAGEWSFALGGIVALNEDKQSGLKAGTIQWGGVPNMRWWIDRHGGTCGFFATQLFPPGEAKHTFLLKMFQREVVTMYKE